MIVIGILLGFFVGRLYVDKNLSKPNAFVDGFVPMRNLLLAFIMIWI